MTDTPMLRNSVKFHQTFSPGWFHLKVSSGIAVSEQPSKIEVYLG